MHEEAFNEYAQQLATSLNDPNIAMDRWNTRDLAQFFQVSDSTIRAWIKAKKLEGFQELTETGHGDYRYGRWYVPTTAIITLENRVRAIEPNLRRYWPGVVYKALHAKNGKVK